MMKPGVIGAVVLGGVVVAGWLLGAAPDGEKSHKLTTISPKKFADSLHAVIAADREAYARLVVERLAVENPKITVSRDWQAQGCLPTHAQLLRQAALSIQKRGAEFSYTLRSLWPINVNHGPQTEVEQAGLEAVARAPQAPYYAEETLGGRSYFTAVYADTAVLASCAECHNRDTSSPRHDFKPGDVMGGIVVRVPLEF